MTDRVVDKAYRVIKNHSLCDNCLGRLFGFTGYNLRNEERGRSIKTILLMDAYSATDGIKDKDITIALAETGFEPAITILAKYDVEITIKECEICKGLLKELDEIVDRIIDKTKDYEFRTFQVGCRVPSDMVVREEKLWTLYDLRNAESFKSEFTREVGKRLSEKTGKEYSLHLPDLVIIVDLVKDAIEISSKSLYIYGRYCKFARGLPQNPWLYEHDERIKYNTSIEEIITAPLIEMAQAKGAKFHAAGREDIDVRMLGNGRPFVVEVKDPKIRSIDLTYAEGEINRNSQGLISVHGLKFVDKSFISKIKALSEISSKVYVAVARFSKPVRNEELSKLEEFFKEIVIIQRTPKRVLHRRTDRVRRKVVYEVKARKLDDNKVEFRIKCQGGLYVKELIHGDRGRTKPNFAEFLNNEVLDITLDVVEIQEVV